MPTPVRRVSGGFRSRRAFRVCSKTCRRTRVRSSASSTSSTGVSKSPGTPRFEPRLVDQFLDECKLPRDFFKGARALDAGCGSGRWSYALAELGAELVAFDLTSGGIEMAQQNLGDRDNVSICQANIFQPPFEEQAFDFAMSWGVLHHTPDTHAAFKSLVRS